MSKTNEKAPATEVLKGQATEEQIAAWKKEHPNGIYGVECDGRIGYFCNPNLNHLNMSMALADPAQPMKKWKELADVTWLGGDEELLNNDYLFISIGGHIQDAARGKESKLAKL